MRGLIAAVLLVALAGPALAQTCKGTLTSVAGEKRCLAAKDTFRDCADCPEMVVIPAGKFVMGSDVNSDETPVRTVTFARPFAMSRTEVTFALWDLCVAEGGCTHTPNDKAWGRGAYPVIDVSLIDATTQFLPWLSRRSGHAYRLPTEAEWEYAARAGSTTEYAWGNSIGAGKANCDRCGSKWDNKSTAPVGSFQANAFGLQDMHGNLWEWTIDCYVGSYAGAPVDGRAVHRPECRSHVVRGGGWNDRPRYLRSAIRYGDPPGYRSVYVGLRLVRDLP